MKTRLLGATIAATAMAIGGCVVAPMPPGGPYYGDPVMVAPPPPRAEYVGPAPIAGQIWIAGFWNWTGRRHDWVSGHWEAPRRGSRWVPRRWDRDGDRWRQGGGYWDDGRGRR